MTIPAELVRRDTGEVVNAIVPFDMATYLSDTKSQQSLAQQKGLMAAYDAAVAALIGENDVQKEGGRTFKKKSAWRKLARHFGISVACSLDSVRVERHELGFTAFAVANAVAPWGQSWTDVGACASDEATGRRVITEADAVATAMTRASNRAVSNLIAMGEVSAEEMGERKTLSNGGETRAARDKKMPIGKHKGTLLGAMLLADLESAAKWCRDTDAKKFGDLIVALDEVIKEKKSDETGGNDYDAAGDEKLDDDLPFR